MLSGPLVSTHWLAEHLDNPRIRVVDIRGHVLPASEPPPHYFAHRDAYEESHIPGAVFIDWTTDIVEPGTFSYDIANPERYAACMSRSGIGDDSIVIAYDDASGMFAARLWWTLLYYGHRQVAVLDGGWQKWLAEQHPVTSAIPSISPVSFTARIDERVFADAQTIAACRANATLLDVRTLSEFRGETSRVERKGRIPNAINLPRNDLLADDGTLLKTEQLRLRFAEIGLTAGADEIITYCNAGVSASYALLALHVAGYHNGRVYDGSWKDWATNAANPIESD